MADNYVCDGAKIECQLCTKPEGQLKVTSNEIKLQDKLFANSKDKEKVNLIFQGNCKKSSFQSSPCQAVITTQNWQNTADLIVQDAPALLASSTIMCAYGGTEIKITDDLQKSVLTELTPSDTDSITPDFQPKMLVQSATIIPKKKTQTTLKRRIRNADETQEDCYAIEEIEILDLDEGSDNNGKGGTKEGMIYGKEYKLKVKKYFDNKKPKDLKIINWEYSYKADDGKLIIESIEDKGDEISFKVDNLDLCKKTITFYAYIESNEDEGKIKKHVITYPKIIFVNGHWNKVAHKLGMSPGIPTEGYWEFFTNKDYFEQKAKSYFGAYNAEPEYIDGSSLLGIDQSGNERKNKGYNYTKENYEKFIYGLGNESVFLISHSEGGAFAAGIAKYLIEKGLTVKESIMLSADEGDEFSVEGNYPCYQITAGYLSEKILSSKKYFNVDPVVGDNKIKGITKYGIYIENAEFATVHGATINSKVFSLIEMLKKVKTQEAWNSKGRIVYVTNPRNDIWYRINDKIIDNKRIDYYPDINNDMITQKYKPRE